jgi:molybdopterin-guanine dinucleotide biosynthesis protein A
VKLACAASGGRTHPVIGLWPIALADDLRHALTVQGERKIDRYTERHGVTTVEWPTDPVDPFFNANEPDDLKTAEKILAELLRPRDA